MTTIGKILTFLILILSLAWGYLTVNAFVARTNWRAEANRYQKEATAAADSANKMKTLLDSERDAAEDAKRALQQERERLYTQVNLLKTQLDTLSKTYEATFTDTKTKAADVVKVQANVDKLNQQVKTLDDQLKAREATITALTLEKEAARVAASAAQIERDGIKKQNETLTERNAKLTSDLEEIVRYGRAGALPGQLTPTVPEGFRATVLTYRADKLVDINAGLDAGLQKGSELKVTRAGNYLGALRVVRSDPKNAVGEFIPAYTGRALTADSAPRAGDIVTK